MFRTSHTCKVLSTCPTLCHVLNIGHLGLSSQAYPRRQLSGLAPFHGESVAREGRVTNLFPQLASGGGEDLNPESLAHKWGKDEGIWMQVMDSAGGLTSPLSLQTSGKNQGPEPASAGVQAEVDTCKRLSGVSEPAPAWGAHGVPHCREPELRRSQSWLATSV